VTGPNSLEQIARDYHDGSFPDMHIENMCQEYESEWLLEQIPGLTRILDLGYGDGITFQALAQRHEVVLLEGSPSLCSAARAAIDENAWAASVFETMFEDFAELASFEAVVAAHILEQVADPVGILRQIRSWLRPGGHLIGIVPNADSLHRQLGEKMGVANSRFELSPRDLAVGHLRVYNWTTLCADLSDAGFEVVKYRGFFVKPLSNAQMIDFDIGVLHGLLKMSDDFNPELCANLAFVAKSSALD